MNRFVKFFYILISVFFVMIVISLGFQTRSRELFIGNGESTYFNKNWKLTWEDGTTQEISSLPYKLGQFVKGTVCLENTIPEEFYGKTMIILSANQRLRIELDGQEIYHLDSEDNNFLGRTPGTLYNFIKIPDETAKGVMRIYCDPVYDSEISVINAIQFADNDTAVVILIKDTLLKVALTLVILFMAILIVIISFMCSMTIGREPGTGAAAKGVSYLAVFAFISSLYYFIQIRLLVSFVGNPGFFEFLAYISFMVMGMSLIIYYKANILSDYVKTINPLVIVFGVNIIVQTILQFTGVVDLYNMQFVTVILAIICLTCGMVLIFRLFQRERSIYFFVHLLALFILTAGYVYDIVRVTFFKETINGDIGHMGRITCSVYCLILGALQYVYVYKSYNLKMEADGILLQQQVEAVAVKNDELELAKSQAEEAQLKAVQANEAKSNFLARISHEIRTPINAVLGMDEMILQESKDKVIKSYATDIKNAGNTLLSLINDILDFSKIESGKMELTQIEYDLFGMVNDLDTMICFRAEAKNLAFLVEVNPDLPSVLYGDDLRIKQIIMNLLTNAVKYTQKGTVSLKVDGDICADKLMLHIEVSDTGIGIKPEDISKLYEKFQRIEEKRNRNIEGTGLGMNIAVQLLNMMNSQLHVESEYGRGSRFYFDLEQPIIDFEPIGDYHKLAQRMDKEYKTALYAPEASVLMIDDNEMNCRVFKNLLKKTGIQVTDGNSGKECLALVQKNHYDIIFMDHMMPEMDGIETFQKMQALEENQCRDTPVIIFTANAIKGAKEKYLEEGFEDFLSKPIIPEQLEDIIRNNLPEELVRERVDEDYKEPSKTEEVHELPMIQGVDWQIAMLHFTGADMLKDTVDTFCATLPVELETIEKLYHAIDQADALDNYRIKVHALKSTSALVGAMAVSSLAKLLEQAAKDKNMQDIHAMTPVLLREGRKLSKEFSDNLQQGRERVGDKYILDLLTMLEGKIRQLDIDGCDEVMEAIKKYEIKPSAQEAYQKLRADIVNIDMEEALRDVEMINKEYLRG